MSQIFYVILGLTIIATSNLVGTLALVFFYFKVAKIEEVAAYKFKLSLVLSGVNLVTQFLSLIVFSSTGVPAYVIAAFILSMIGYLGVMRYGYKYHLLECAIIATSLAIILNPVWLRLFGII